MDTTAPAILDIGIVLLAAVGAGAIARRIGLPAVVGYLVLGLAVSPFTPGYVADREQLQLLADFGVVLLLFEVGIEVDPLALHREQRGLLLASPLQVLASAGLSGLVFSLLGLAPVAAAVLGLCVGLSSSVVIANMTRSARRTTDPPTESALLGWSVLQDLTGVTVAAGLLATLGTNGRSAVETLAELGAFAVLALAVAWLLPRTLRAVQSQPDFFLIVSVASGFALAGVGSVVFGVPLALAAFVGGLAVTESPESAEARRRLLPFRDLFAVLFFVAIGTLIDPAALQRGLGWLGLLLALIIATKVAVAYGLARLLRLEARPLQLAVGLGQVGEFSFVLASALVGAGLLASEVYAAVLAAVAISIGGSSVLVRLVPRAKPAAASGSATAD